MSQQVDRSPGGQQGLAQPRRALPVAGHPAPEGPYDPLDADRTAGREVVPVRRHVLRMVDHEASRCTVTALAEGKTYGDAFVSTRPRGLVLRDGVAHAVDDPLAVDLGDRLHDMGVLADDEVDVRRGGQR